MKKNENKNKVRIAYPQNQLFLLVVRFVFKWKNEKENQNQNRWNLQHGKSVDQPEPSASISSIIKSKSPGEILSSISWRICRNTSTVMYPLAVKMFYHKIDASKK